MIVGPNFIWLHVPKCGGSSVENCLRATFGKTPGYEFDVITPEGPVIWHQNIAERQKIQPEFSQGDRKIIACIRRLPSWILSRIHFEAARNGEDYVPKRADLIRGYFIESGRSLRKADQVIKYYMSSQVDSWIRLENLKGDLEAAIGSEIDPIRKINETTIQYIKKLEFWFTAEEIALLYKNNPAWADIERRVYGNTIEDLYETLSSSTGRKPSDDVSKAVSSSTRSGGIPSAHRDSPAPTVSPAGVDMIHEGRNGWLFLTGGTNRPVDYFSPKKSPFTAKVREGWQKLLRQRRDRSEKLGARYIHLLAPEKLSVYPEFASLDLDLTARPGAQLGALSELHGIFLDPTDHFQRVKDEATVYWKTNTLWSWWGCFSAYQLLMSQLGLKVDNTLLSRPFAEGPVTFDLGSKMEPPIRETARFYRPIQDSVRIHANELVLFQEKHQRFSEIELHVGTSVVYRNDVNPANDRKVVLFGDSFSEYRPSLLTGMLAESFREIHFLWTANMDFDYIEKVRPDFVISESAERFMARVPTDNVNFENFVADRMKLLSRQS